MEEQRRICRRSAVCSHLLWSMMFCLMITFCITCTAQAEAETARPSGSGALHVSGTTLADQNGKTVALRGLSTHGLTWFPEFVDETLFGQLSEEDLRLRMPGKDIRDRRTDKKEAAYFTTEKPC